MVAPRASVTRTVTVEGSLTPARTVVTSRRPSPFGLKSNGAVVTVTCGGVLSRATPTTAEAGPAGDVAVARSVTAQSASAVVSHDAVHPSVPSVSIPIGIHVV